jgi:hypothetical protein
VERFILRFRGTGPAQPEDLERIKAVSGVTVIDESSPHMILVEAPHGALDSVVAGMPGWLVAKQGEIPLPDTRKKPGKAPGT